MSYEKTIWEIGDTITAEKLNNIEGGIDEVFENEIFVIRVSYNIINETATVDKTFSEIVSAVNNNKTIVGFKYDINNGDVVGSFPFSSIKIKRMAPQEPINSIDFVLNQSSLYIYPPNTSLGAFTVYTITLNEDNTVTATTQYATWDVTEANE